MRQLRFLLKYNKLQKPEGAGYCRSLRAMRWRSRSTESTVTIIGSPAKFRV